MKDYSWVVIGVLTILMVVQEFHDDIVATTPNYFNRLADIEDPKTFVCASMYKKPTDRKNKKVIFDVKYRKDDKIVDIPMEPSRLYLSMRGISFGTCDECPNIVDYSVAYRFYSKNGVYGVYTSTWHSSYGNQDNVVKEGYIKASFSLTRNADGTGKKELSPETKTLIEEARAKAKELGIDIVENVPYGCNTEPPRAELPPPKVTPTERSYPDLPPPKVTPTERSSPDLPPPKVTPTERSSPDLPPPKVSPTERSPAKISSESKSLIHKYGIAMIILIVGGLAAQTAILYGTR